MSEAGVDTDELSELHGDPSVALPVGSLRDPPAENRGEANEEFGGEELPMVVWLRGDEPYVADFSLDAEQVMARLNIRRSRLTQISGKELRVGRMRKGRYVSPVYRPIDVTAYLAWTRPPATHQKAAEVIDEVVSRLDDRQEALQAGLDILTATLAHAPRQLMDALLPLIHAQRREIAAFTAEFRFAFAALTPQIARLTGAIDQLDADAKRRDERLQVALSALLKLSQEAGGAVRVLAAEVAELAKLKDWGVTFEEMLDDKLRPVATKPVKAPSRAAADSVRKQVVKAAQAPSSPQRPQAARQSRKYARSAAVGSRHEALFPKIR